MSEQSTEISTPNKTKQIYKEVIYISIAVIMDILTVACWFYLDKQGEEANKAAKEAEERSYKSILQEKRLEQQLNDLQNRK